MRSYRFRIYKLSHYPVKKKLGGGKRYKAAEKAKAQGAPAPGWEGPAPPKHLQRKISKKVNFLDKVAQSKAAALSAKPVIHKKVPMKTALDLSSLSGIIGELGPSLNQQSQQKSLMNSRGNVKSLNKEKARRVRGPATDKTVTAEKLPIKSCRVFGQAVGTLRVRKMIMAQEKERVQQVVAHPMYQLDPITAITNHLTATLPPRPMAAAHSNKDSSLRKRKIKK
ncbi:hypothetical protein CEUSTIGMA_g1004.t1 [Chlamydomonas eustigma]|uniref:Ribosome biogenesis protein SLX9 n=1 Tax=Chlamydomonas eustigma TaxID=1157962 RepID=A0A250WRW9_9CHLO|nr:hypothetical protein CEUSTIGMA_g1004.t1 [Chlamydomonas eustigma]|eukprot:GAX73553.1 hypothetical protein CEUSTIGMA_g1004.t1 [Chlamydomonas eustigma]